MTFNLPLCCSPAAFQALKKQLPSLDSPDALVNSAVAISMHQLEGIDANMAERTLQDYADTIRGRVRGRQQQAMVAHLHNLLFEEQGFAGNTADYYGTANSYLPAVIESKRGLPITLSLIYVDVARRLGLHAWGVGLPGHFMAGIEMDGETTLVDPFAGGRIVTADEAHARLREMFGPEVEWSEELLRPVSNRLWITRMLQNLLNVFTNAGQFADVAAMLEMEMLLWPDQSQLQRDLALVLARCGLSQPASVWLDRYLKSNPEDPQRPQLQQLLEVLST